MGGDPQIGEPEATWERDWIPVFESSRLASCHHLTSRVLGLRAAAGSSRGQRLGSTRSGARLARLLAG